MTFKGVLLLASSYVVGFVASFILVAGTMVLLNQAWEIVRKWTKALQIQIKGIQSCV